MKTPKVSIIIPTYNRVKKLAETIKSLNKIDYPKNKIELIIVDDCSTDSTFEYLKPIIRSQKIRYFKTKVNSGPASARNIGIRNSSGKYIFFTDDDCLVEKNILKKYISFLEENKDVAGAGGYLIPKVNNIFAKIEKIKDKMLGLDNKSKKIGKNVSAGYTSNVIYRKSVLDEVGYFNENYKVPSGEDSELRKRITSKYSLATLPTKVYHNHDYDLDYILAIVIKQGLNEFPPKNTFFKILKIIYKFPKLIYISIKKFRTY